MSSVTGTISDGETLELECDDFGTALLHISGTYSGDIYLEGKIDDADWFGMAAFSRDASDGQPYLPIQSPGLYCANIAGTSFIRVRAAGLFTGTAVVEIGAIQSPSVVVAAEGYIFTKQAGDDTFIVEGTVEAAQSGTWNIATVTTLTGITNPVAVTQSGTWNITNVSGTVSLPTGASTLVEQQTQTASLSVLDDWDESDRAKVNLIVGQTGVQGASGAVSANTQRVVLATDVALPTGANVIGALSANQSVNVAQMNGVTVTMGNGASGTGVQRVTIADDSTGKVVLATGSNTIGALSANQSINNAQVNGGTVVTSVTGVQDVMPRKRSGSTGLSPNYTTSHITTKTTTTPTAATAYVSAIAISCSAAGTAWTLKIQNKEGTPLILVPAFTLAVPTTGLPIIIQFAEPIIMTSGIDIVTAGTTAGTVDVFITYWN